jgi:hypothetical protein
MRMQALSLKGQSRPFVLLGQNVWQWTVIATMIGAYAATVTPGHVFEQDDFAAYLMHAANLVEGRPYTAINYVPNPDALWIAPSHGYPPVYPLLLAPVYRFLGFNLRAMKLLTVLCFGGFLVAYVSFLKTMLPLWARIMAVLVVGGNIAFWEQRDYLLSELPYLLFSFYALLVAQSVYQDLDPRRWRLRDAILLSSLLYTTCGTRTIGVSLIPALVLADVLKYKRPSRFLILVVSLTAGFVVLQSVILISPKGYIDAVHVSTASVFEHAVYYAKVLSYAWQNGYSKGSQIAFALLFTALAVAGFVRRIWSQRSVTEFYLLAYLAVIIAWSAEIGMRGLLPMLPLYFAYGLEEFLRVVSAFGRTRRLACATVLFAFIGASYIGSFGGYSRRKPSLDVRDPSAQELFSFLRATTYPGDVLVFPNPRTLALFTDRPVASLAPTQTPEQSGRFLAAIHAKVLVQAETMAYPLRILAAEIQVNPVPVFRNASFQVFLVDTRPGQ